MNDKQDIRAHCEEVLMNGQPSFRNLVDLIDNYVSSDQVYQSSEEYKDAIFALQEDLARVELGRSHPPESGFLSLEEAQESIRFFLRQTTPER